MECKTMAKDLLALAYKQYRDELLRYLYGSLHDMDDAEDMLQDLFLRLLKIKLLSEKSMRSLLFTMAKRMVIDSYRHKVYVCHAERMMYADTMLYDENSIVRKIEASDILSFERKYIDRMPVKRALIYQMYKHDDISIADIAQSLHLSKRTVESQIYNSTKEMKSYLKNII